MVAHFDISDVINGFSGRMLFAINTGTFAITNHARAVGVSVLIALSITDVFGSGVVNLPTKN
ncbi:hypothetical protein [Moraxella equi]|uniref:Uncharacterized protein n=1 Tax=Moraxella equi TaxID=60442 RepID=A0A378QV15_9GAMM|nr:hypothetical protein [Moraxella equi]OPH33102.1 hypothetical protein B5J93_13200 [Moraxella equi]STZ04292.1 Uncharacterised protein [Moraxella equi]